MAYGEPPERLLVTGASRREKVTLARSVHGGSHVGDRGEHDHRDLAICLARVLGEIREAIGPAAEQPRALPARRLRGDNVDRLASDLDFGPRVCPQVVVPGG